LKIGLACSAHSKAFAKIHKGIRLLIVDGKIALDYFLDVRKVVNRHLPTEGSLVSLDILLFLYWHYGKYPGTGCPLKLFFTSLPYSDMGIRYHLSRLANRKWLYLEINSADKRSKDIFLTAKTIQKFHTIEAEIASLLKNVATSK
jgi:hypothetical protein